MKVALDQLVFAPIFIGVFISAINVCEGKGWEDIKKELNEKYFDN